jgi:hypothetical protein
VIGPNLPVGLALCCVAAFPEADIRSVLQHSRAADDLTAGPFGRSMRVVGFRLQNPILTAETKPATWPTCSPAFSDDALPQSLPVPIGALPKEG